MTQPVLELLDPASLLVDLNIRPADVDEDLVASVADHGVLQPIVATRTDDGAIRVRHGHRRTLAAIKAGRDQVPVVILTSDRVVLGGDVERVLAQYDENTRRRGLTPVEEAGVVQQLLDLGLTAADVAGRTRLGELRVAAARRLNASAKATAAAEHQGLTLDQAAAVAEFDDDDDAVRDLVAASAEGDGQFRQALQARRDDRDHKQARDDLAARLTADGVKIADKRPDFDYRISQLTTADGKPLTEKNHAKCPGRVAWLDEEWDHQARKSIWEVVWYCADPNAHGHRSVSGRKLGDGDIDLEAQRAERQRVLAGNKAWRSARTVRREWLTGQLTATKPLKGASRFIAEALAQRYTLRFALERLNETGRELLGVKDDDGSALSELVSRASETRATMITLALVIGAYEDCAGDDAWRYPGRYRETGRYLTTLAGWGYELSAVEQAVADGKPFEAAK